MSLEKKFSGLSVKEISADDLECPVCLEICKQPSFECRNGHLVCGDCWAGGNITICPVCRDTQLVESVHLKDYLARCIYKCKYAEDGCMEKFKGDEIKKHENHCEFKLIPCYVESCKRLIGKIELDAHIASEHVGRVFRKTGQLRIYSEFLGTNGTEREIYYFIYDQRVYTVTVKFGTKGRIKIWANALNLGKITGGLHIKIALEDERKLTWMKTVSEKGEPPKEDTSACMTLTNLRHIRYILLDVSFVKITRSYQPGCSHYQRNCRLICPSEDCKEIVSCRICHDSKIKSHAFDRFKVHQVICCQCGWSQAPGKECKRCEKVFAKYFCPKCNLYDDDEDASMNIYHCDDCGLCRRKESPHSEYCHCHRCDTCVLASTIQSHKCLPNAARKNCIFCGQALHSSRIPIISIKCGHYTHTTCNDHRVEMHERRCETR